MSTRERMHGLCAWLKRYQPLINLGLWVTTISLFVFLHQDIKRHNFDLYAQSARERMELFDERDRLIIRLMEVRAGAVTVAMQGIHGNTERLENAVGVLERAHADRQMIHQEQMKVLKEILQRLPPKAPPATVEHQ